MMVAAEDHMMHHCRRSVTEEVSREGHFWTVLHYACHYGHIEVLKFLLNYL